MKPLFLFKEHGFEVIGIMRIKYTSSHHRTCHTSDFIKGTSTVLILQTEVFHGAACAPLHRVIIPTSSQ
jgi:hypothetical protein